MDNKSKIIEKIQSMAGRYSAYEIFTDWIRCMALSISNSLSLLHDRLWHEREAEYLGTIRKYSTDEQSAIYEMTGWLVKTLESGPDDVLGNIYMESGMGSKASGQFFTPFHVSEMTAALAIGDIIKSDPDRILELNEPSCGGGGMIIAAAKVLHEAGIDYQHQMKVVAQDLDWKGIYMCYVQLSLLGINAICVQGDTLIEPFDICRTERSHMLFTPAHMGVLL